MGVARDATEAQIKQAYRKLARKYHPDVSKEQDAEARFKEVGEAYEVLKSPEKRAAYDRLGSGPRPGEEFRPPPDFGSGFEFSGAGPSGGGADYSDFFESLFGRAGPGAGRGGRRHFDTGRGEDHHAKIMLDLEAALLGGSRSITLRVPELDAEGRLAMQRARAQRADTEGHPSRPDHPPGRPGVPGSRGARTARRPRRGPVHRGRVSAPSQVSDRRPGSVPRSAGDAVGGGARRQRQDPDARRRGRPENPGRIACRDQAAPQGTRNALLRLRAIFTSCFKSRCRPQPTRRPRRPIAAWRMRCRSIPVQVLECSHHVLARRVLFDR